VRFLSRLLEGLAFAYDLLWAVIFTAGGGGVAIAGALTGRVPMVVVGIVFAFFGVVWMLVEIWPSRGGG